MPFLPAENYTPAVIPQEPKQSFFDRIWRKPRKYQAMAPQTIEQIAQTTDARRAWDETPNGRQRLWCKDCRDLHLEWLTPEPCEHILKAKAEAIVSREEAMETYRRHMMADRTPPQEPHYHPIPLEPKADQEPPKYDI